jgi:hypothetical protein
VALYETEDLTGARLPYLDACVPDGGKK